MEKRYFCIEDEKIYTESDMIALFAECIKSDDSYKNSTFNDYMRDCLSKNGSLREIKTITDRQSENLIKSVKNFTSAFLQLKLSMNMITEESFNRYLCEDYPFSVSFDESFYTVLSWLESIETHAKNKDFEIV